MPELVKEILLREDAERGQQCLFLNGQEFPFWLPNDYLLTVKVPGHREGGLERLKLELLLDPDVQITVLPND